MDLQDYIYIIAPAAGWLSAQTFKFFISLRQDGISWHDLFTSGGMPSSHTSFVSSLTVVIGLTQGFDSAIFGVTLTMLGVVIYDAVGVRRATGENTQMLRTIMKRMKLKDRETAIHLALGHTPYQVFMGLINGITTGLIVYGLLG